MGVANVRGSLSNARCEDVRLEGVGLEHCTYLPGLFGPYWVHRRRLFIGGRRSARNSNRSDLRDNKGRDHNADASAAMVFKQVRNY